MLTRSIISLNQLTKRYGRVRGIEDVSLQVAAGEAFGFLGPNGAGKTTTIRTLLDLLHPTSGSAQLFGLDSHRKSRAIRARLGNLPGEFSCDDRWTGRDLLRFSAAVRGLDGLGRAGELAERFDADLGRAVGELSRGSRQKIGLIQALFHDPELLLLDEPTGGLDPLMREEFLNVLAEHRQRGGTVFLSSHDLDEVERACDRVGMIRDGELIAVEDVEVMRARAYRRARIRFGHRVDIAELRRLPGVDGVEQDDRTFELRLRGRLDPVIRMLARHPVEDLEITRPTLEELFLTHYDHREVA